MLDLMLHAQKVIGNKNACINKLLCFPKFSMTIKL